MTYHELMKAMASHKNELKSLIPHGDPDGQGEKLIDNMFVEGTYANILTSVICAMVIRIMDERERKQ